MTDPAENPPPVTHRLRVGARTIAYCEYGDPAGVPVLAAHGSPGSRYQLAPLAAAATRARVRIISPDRPGFGETTRERRRGFATGSGDAIALLDELGIDSAVALGFSGGAGYSLALAREHPDRIERVVLVCGMLPGAPPRTLRARIPIVTALYRVARFLPGLAVAMLDGRGPFGATRERNLSAWPSADREVMVDAAMAPMMARDARAGARQGSRAAIDDLREYFRRFPLEDVLQPVDLLHGTADGNVPIAVAQWGATRFPDALVREFEQQGHYFAVTHADEVAEALREPRPRVRRSAPAE
ncbi:MULTISPECIES: alpha/beta fold hydrolase [Microbacterium]|uniref:alpha/beta fold hydrolase n=1 Tax=Microbacterium TaxID=33882 RepID=UPI001E2EF96F|nr:alpha/beta hydrolase [Microbacterium nymphoidis]MCD2499378.1 alpha/beta hydrolase [Microbacterium nymphoidis]